VGRPREGRQVAAAHCTSQHCGGWAGKGVRQMAGGEKKGHPARQETPNGGLPVLG
jgi:hypothetical protein